MEADLFDFLLGTQKSKYARFDATFHLTEYSPGLETFLSADRKVEIGCHIAEIFFELIGFDPYLAELRDHQKPPLYLNWINQIPLSVQPGETTDHNPLAAYFHLQVFPFQPGLLVVLRDVSYESEMEQLVYNRRNELDILSKQLINELSQANVELQQAYETTLMGWAKALEMRDGETKGHSDRTVTLMRRLAKRMGMDDADIRFYCYGALLHDIGKMGIPDRILLKPEPLDESDWAIMKTHTLMGEKLLKPIKYLEKSMDIVMYHHEQWNGNGYPHGLKGEEIPLAARIFSVIDVYDAITSHRPYNPARTHEEAIRYIQSRSGIEFDPQVVEHFVAMFQDD
jgi:putative nucleotidyltransferase with HDIG domain